MNDNKWRRRDSAHLNECRMRHSRAQRRREIWFYSVSTIRRYHRVAPWATSKCILYLRVHQLLHRNLAKLVPLFYALNIKCNEFFNSYSSLTVNVHTAHLLLDQAACPRTGTLYCNELCSSCAFWKRFSLREIVTVLLFDFFGSDLWIQ